MLPKKQFFLLTSTALITLLLHAESDSTFTYTLHNGWNLIGAINSTKIDPSIKRIYQYDDGSWKVAGSDFNNSQFSSFEKSKGYWVVASDEQNFSMPDLEATNNDLTFSSSWTLFGAVSNLSKNEYSYKGVDSLWTYEDGTWTEDPTEIEKGAGFWVKSATGGSITYNYTLSNSDSNISDILSKISLFLDTLSSDEKSTLILDWSDSKAKTVWSNLPGVTRNGLRFGDLSEESLAAAKEVAKSVLSDSGYEDFLGVLAADDYLNSIGGSLNGGGGPTGGAPNGGDFGTAPARSTGLTRAEDGTYSSNNYLIAFIGEPSETGDWMIQIGGHHLAYNITFLNGVGYPFPNHIGVEPKASFVIDSLTYAPLAEEGEAMAAVFGALSETELSNAYLAGEVYSDVLIGPDNGSGVLPTDYPTESRGLLVSSLSSAQQEIIKNAIKEWVEDYPQSISARLIEAYTSEAAFQETYVAWAGDQSVGVDVDHSGTYMRIDGPRLWIEVACQAGVIISDQTHYHTMFRDKSMDYANSL